LDEVPRFFLSRWLVLTIGFFFRPNADGGLEKAKVILQLLQGQYSHITRREPDILFLRSDVKAV